MPATLVSERGGRASARRGATTGVNGRSELARKPYHRQGVRAPRSAAALVRRARARPALASYERDGVGRPGLRADVAADAGRPCPARLRAMDGAVADPGVARRRTRRRRDPRLGPT